MSLAVLFGGVDLNFEIWKRKALFFLVLSHFEKSVYFLVIGGWIEGFMSGKDSNILTIVLTQKNSYLSVLSGIQGFLCLFALIWSLIYRKAVVRYYSKIIYKNELVRELKQSIFKESGWKKVKKISSIFFRLETDNIDKDSNDP